MRTCSHCGAANEAEGAFCVNCGSPLADAPASEAPKAEKARFGIVGGGSSGGSAPGGEKARFGVVGGSAGGSAPGGEKARFSVIGGSAGGSADHDGVAGPPDGGFSGGGGFTPPPPRPSRVPLWIALGAVAVILAALAAIFLPRLLRGSPGGDSKSREQTQAAIEQIVSAAEPYQDPNGQVPPENTQAAIGAVYASAQSNPLVTSCQMDPYGVVMHVATGPVYVYCPTAGEPYGGSFTPEPPIPGAAPYAGEGWGELEILTVQPYDSENREIARRGGYRHDLDAPDLAAASLVARDPEHWHFGAANNVNDGALTMDRILSMDDYQVILWHGHGGYTSYTGYFLCTHIPWTEELAARYGLNDSNCCLVSDGTIGLKPSYFEQNFGPDAFYNAYIYIGTCYSGIEPKLAEVFLSKGAAVVYVNSESISRQYNLDMLRVIAEAFLGGEEAPVAAGALAAASGSYAFPPAEDWTVMDALQLACLAYGTSDPYSSEGAQVLCYSTDTMSGMDYEAWLARFAQRPGAEPEPEPGTEIEPEPEPVIEPEPEPAPVQEMHQLIGYWYAMPDYHATLEIYNQTQNRMSLEFTYGTPINPETLECFPNIVMVDGKWETRYVDMYDNTGLLRVRYEDYTIYVEVIPDPGALPYGLHQCAGEYIRILDFPEPEPEPAADDIYIRYMKDHPTIRTDLYTQNDVFIPSCWALADLSGDGTPELLLGTAQDSYFSGEMTGVLIVMLNDWGELEPAYYVDTDTVYNYPDLCYGRWLVTYGHGTGGYLETQYLSYGANGWMTLREVYWGIEEDESSYYLPGTEVEPEIFGQYLLQFAGYPDDPFHEDIEFYPIP